MAKGDHTIDSSKASVSWLVFIQLVIAGEVLVKRINRWRMFAAAGWAMALVLAVLMMLMVAGWMEAGCVPNVGEGR